MNWILISGLSGAGKSIAMRALEDLGFFCVDNLPMTMVPALAEQVRAAGTDRERHVAVVVDARGAGRGLEKFSDVVKQLGEGGINPQVIFLEAEDNVLIARFKETRRRHPLTSSDCPLSEAISRERALLAPLRESADVIIDTTHTHLYQLRDLVRQRLYESAPNSFSVLLQSFGYKNGVPQDADMVFDARCLPNPFWKPELRSLTGQDEEVVRYLKDQPEAAKMLASLESFLDEWIPAFEHDNRAYLNIAIGCTGGQHRSVYLVDRIAEHLSGRRESVIVRHRELD
ncbi:MAG TPA: RNase adapter RapZ [Gammaproteobacteria bacterium]|nr:RNase adapter RapZ [Gammaproteobacteria bacterium]